MKAIGRFFRSAYFWTPLVTLGYVCAFSFLIASQCAAQIMADNTGRIVVLDTSAVVRVLPAAPFTVDSVRLWADGAPINRPLRLARGDSVLLEAHVFWTDGRSPENPYLEVLFNTWDCSEGRAERCARDSTLVDIDAGGMLRVIGAIADSVDIRIAVAVVIFGAKDPRAVNPREITPEPESEAVMIFNGFDFAAMNENNPAEVKAAILRLAIAVERHDRLCLDLLDGAPQVAAPTWDREPGAEGIPGEGTDASATERS